MAKKDGVDVNELDQVMVASSGDALAMANAGAKAPAGAHVTDVSEAKEVTKGSDGTTIVRW